VAAGEKNEVGLVIGGTITPSQTLAPGVTLTGPTGAAPPTRDLKFDAALSLGAEYDRRFFAANHVAFYGGIDFWVIPMMCT